MIGKLESMRRKLDNVAFGCCSNRRAWSVRYEGVEAPAVDKPTTCKTCGRELPVAEWVIVVVDEAGAVPASGVSGE